MRLDKFLKVTRIIKRRTIAKELADNGNIQINNEEKKSSYSVKAGDVLDIKYFNKNIKIRVKEVPSENLRKEDIENYELTRYEEMIKMIDLSMEYAKEMGLNPYYMYRQKHMLGNLENIGYAKEGYDITEELQTESLTQKYEAKAPKKGSTDIFAICRKVEKEENNNNEIENLGTANF